jgi:hypothetical protein
MIYLEKEFTSLENLLEYFRKSDCASRKKIPGCIFSEKLILGKGSELRARFSV